MLTNHRFMGLCYLLSLVLSVPLPALAQVRGDLSGDTQVDQADLKLLEQYLDGSGLLSEQQVWQADLNGDNRVDQRDRALLQEQLRATQPAAVPAASPTQTGQVTKTSKKSKKSLVWSEDRPPRVWSADTLPLKVYIGLLPEKVRGLQGEYNQAVEDAIKTWNNTGIQGQTIFRRTLNRAEANVLIAWNTEQVAVAAAGLEQVTLGPRLVPERPFLQIKGSQILLFSLFRKQRVIPTGLLGFFLPIPTVDIPLENIEQRQGNEMYGLALHELGHSLGLNHNNDSSDVMYPQEAGGIILFGLEFRQGQSLTKGTKDKLARLYAEAWGTTAPETTLPPTLPDTPALTLIKACAAGQTPEVERLLRQGVDINSKEQGGWTPLIAAAAEGHTPLVQLLLEKGALTSIADNYGYTALRYAQLAQHNDIIRLLNQASSGGR
ncbi:ankyrin repeat domain-containing protein [Anthocerotibacter panamensis]|uniref:ankyrin repeat domain-containing protein n=1 Tax=Anthocerotibacter panamensis TaxID=2857077 RepID=UPI001C404E5D|nr:ankyrin repeat domain-containing protein [Anthocerotibacter panamensis]